MYSRKTGILYNPTETQRKIDNFNKNLREQYQNKGVVQASNTQSNITTSERENGPPFSEKALGLLKNENIILLALVSLLLFEKNKDYVLVGVLAILLFLE